MPFYTQQVLQGFHTTIEELLTLISYYTTQYKRIIAKMTIYHDKRMNVCSHPNLELRIFQYSLNVSLISSLQHSHTI